MAGSTVAGLDTTHQRSRKDASASDNTINSHRPDLLVTIGPVTNSVSPDLVRYLGAIPPFTEIKRLLRLSTFAGHILHSPMGRATAAPTARPSRAARRTPLSTTVEVASVRVSRLPLPSMPHRRRRSASGPPVGGAVVRAETADDVDAVLDFWRLAAEDSDRPADRRKAVERPISRVPQALLLVVGRGHPRLRSHRLGWMARSSLSPSPPRPARPRNQALAARRRRAAATQRWSHSLLRCDGARCQPARARAVVGRQMLAAGQLTDVLVSAGPA